MSCESRYVSHLNKGLLHMCVLHRFQCTCLSGSHPPFCIHFSFLSIHLGFCPPPPMFFERNFVVGFVCFLVTLKLKQNQKHNDFIGCPPCPFLPPDNYSSTNIKCILSIQLPSTIPSPSLPYNHHFNFLLKN